MTARISDICSALSRGIARPNRYNVSITAPFGNINYLSALCEASELPGKSYLTTERQTYGPPRKMPYKVQYANITMTFICSAIMAERDYFDKWQAKISDINNHYFAYYDDYVSDITIEQRDEEGYVGYGVKLLEAYPVEVHPQHLSYSLPDYQKLVVVFTYHKWMSYRQTGVPVRDSGTPNEINNGNQDIALPDVQTYSREELGTNLPVTEPAYSERAMDVGNDPDTSGADPIGKENMSPDWTYPGRKELSGTLNKGSGFLPK